MFCGLGIAGSGRVDGDGGADGRVTGRVSGGDCRARCCGWPTRRRLGTLSLLTRLACFVGVFLPLLGVVSHLGDVITSPSVYDEFCGRGSIRQEE